MAGDANESMNEDQQSEFPAESAVTCLICGEPLENLIVGDREYRQCSLDPVHYGQSYSLANFDRELIEGAKIFRRITAQAFLDRALVSYQQQDTYF